MVKISVVIPTLNEEKYLTGILQDLESQLLKPHEVIIVDGQSEDRTKEVAEQFEFVKFIETERGVGHQRQFGCTQATGDLLILFDADGHIQPGFLRNVVTQFETKPFDIACPQYVPRDRNIAIKLLFGILNIVFLLTQKFAPSGGGPCIITTKTHWEQAGGFDRNATYDDIEFIRRAGKLGKFRILNQRVFISTRRFHKYGVARVIAQYLRLAWLFAGDRNLKVKDNEYEFGKFS